MDERNYQHSYENGSTKPPKSHGGVIAVVICTVIFLCGILSALGLWDQNNNPTATHSGDVIFSDINDSTEPATDATSSSTGTPNADNQLEVDLNPGPGQVDNIPQSGGLSLQAIYEKNLPSVVSVICTLSTGTGTGTGVVLSQDGYIVTNAHVVNGATAIGVLLNDGRELQAQLIGEDELSDLAVLHVDAADLTPAEFGDSAQARVGDAVVAIGDPLGVAFRGTMTDGIVSAINRNVKTNGRTMTLIQTNAALNSGNSGGPLINCHGQVIGLNTLKIGAFTDDAGVEGLGFAIPSAYVKEIVDQLMNQGYVSGRPALPFKGEWVDSFSQQFKRLPAGLYVTEAPENSPIQAKDILLYVDHVRVTEDEELNNVLYSHNIGDTLKLVIYRNGRQYSLDITLVEAGK